MQGNALRIGFALMLGLAAAGCESEGVGRVELGLDHPAMLDFGRVSLGVEARAGFELVATGQLGVSLWTFEVVEGPFVVVSAPTLVLPGQPRSVEFQVRPLVAGPIAGRLRFGSNVDGGSTHEVALRVEGLTDALEIRPAPIDFGYVRLGDQWTTTFEVFNRLTGPVQLRLPVGAGGRIEVSGGSGFLVEGPIGQDGLWGRLESGSRAELQASFRPSFEGESAAQVELRYCEHPLCRQPVRLRGTGVKSALRCSPLQLDYGYVSPGIVTSRMIRCDNPTQRALQLQAPLFSGSDGDQFRIEGRLPERLGPGEAVEIPVAVEPDQSMRRQTLTAALDLRAFGAGGGTDFVQIPLTAVVARAELDVIPSALAFGRVAVGVEVTRTVALLNVGDRPLTVVDVVAPPPFAVAGPSAFTLQPGESVTLDASVLAQAEGLLEGAIDVRLDDPDLPSRAIPLSAIGLLLPPCQVQLQPASIEFGLVAAHAVQRRSTLVSNVSSFPCLVRSPQVEGVSFAAVPLDPSDVLLEPGASVRVEADFAPTRGGEFRGRLRVPVSDPIRPWREVPLSGVAGQGELRVDPELIDFGTVRPLCRSRTRTVRLLNLGSAPLPLDRVDVSTPEFELVNPPSGVPTPPGPGPTLPGGAEMLLNLRFQPAVPGRLPPSVLTVLPRGATAATTVELRAEAIDGPTTERFRQGPVPAVDVLFVIDNSLSMREKQASVIANAGRFMDVLDAAGSDYHLAVISTDMSGPNQTSCPTTALRPANMSHGRCGYFSDGDAVETRPDWTVIDRSERPSPRAAFVRSANVGLTGSAEESGLAAAAAALSSTKLGGHNSGFLRPSARLEVIFISDEEDSSSGTVASYLAALRALKARPEDVSASGVLTTGAACGIEASQRYSELIAALGGIKRSICTQDWSVVVEDLARRALGLRVRFELDGLPDPSTVEVRVDGVVVPNEAPITARRIWTLESQRAVVFEPEAAPPPGSEVTVSYVPECP